MKACFLFLFLLLQISCFAESESNLIKYLPVQHDGRIKPLDTVARSSLLLLHGSQNINHQGRKLSAIDWLLDVIMNSKNAKDVKLIRVENKDLLKFLGKKIEKPAYFSISELQQHIEELYSLSSQIMSIEEKEQDAYQRAIIVLWQQITLFLRLSNTFWIAEIENIPSEFKAFEQVIDNDSISLPYKKALPISLEWFQKRYEFLSQVAYCKLFPSSENKDQWLNIGESLLSMTHDKYHKSIIDKMINIISSYQRNSRNFDRHVNDYIKEMSRFSPNIGPRIKFEVINNQLQPFFLSSLIYLTVIFLSILSWIFNLDKLRILIFTLFIAGCVLHSLGLFARMYIESRPPVTNLYSSAIFVGFGAVIFSLFMENKYRNNTGSIAGSIIGALTLIIAHHLSMNGDTIEVLRAVLNSNFWLSTHVVMITLGYSSTFLAGSLGIIYIFRGLFTLSLDTRTSNILSNMVYKTIGFSTFFTFIGTVLGGLWADQSWGRFWGWDPKENGALLIILWNVIILHARIAKFIKTRGMMLLSVFGNVITALSWFGVNILGVGLHSYGFIQGTFLWLVIFVLSQIGILGIGLLPKRYWRSQENG